MSYLPSFSETKGLHDPAPSWRWVVRMPDLVPMGGGSPATLEGLSPVSQAPFGRVSTIDFGVRQIDSDQRFKAGKRVNFPRFVTMPSVNITFIEDVEYSVMKYLRSWSNLIYDENGNYGVAADYKFTITLFAFDTISNTQAVMVGFMRGCWPTNLSGLQYAYDNSGPVTISMEFAVDEDIVQLGGVVGGLYGAADFLTTFGGAFDQFSNFASSFGFGDLGGFGEIGSFLGDVQSGVRSVQNTVRQAQSAVNQVQNQVQRVLSIPNQVAGQVRGTLQGIQGQVRQVASIPQQAQRQVSSTVSSFRSITGGFRF